MEITNDVFSHQEEKENFMNKKERSSRVNFFVNNGRDQTNKTVTKLTNIFFEEKEQKRAFSRQSRLNSKDENL